MELAELLLIILGLLFLIYISIATIVRISSFYRNKYGFSVWSGVIVLLPVLILSAIAYGGEIVNTMLVVAGVILIGYTIVQDIRLAGPYYGTIAFLFQVLMTLLLILVLIIIIARVLARAILKKANQPTGIYPKAIQEIRYGVILLPIFIRI